MEQTSAKLIKIKLQYLSKRHVLHESGGQMKSNDMGPKFESLGPNMQCLDPCSVSVVGFTMTF